MKLSAAPVAALGLGLVLAAEAQAQLLELEIAPTADTTLFQDADNLSNGAGIHLFAGRIANGLRRRPLLRFADLSSIPEDAVIVEVTLRLSLSRKRQGAGPLRLFVHRLAATWGEAGSDAGTPGGVGAAAAPQDATWGQRFFPDEDWVNGGGDYDPEESTSVLVDDIADYTWPATDRTLADLRAWRADPESNHGWILVDRVSAPVAHARRFYAREESNAARQPRLIVRFELPLFKDSFEQ